MQCECVLGVTGKESWIRFAHKGELIVTDGEKKFYSLPASADLSHSPCNT